MQISSRNLAVVADEDNHHHSWYRRLRGRQNHHCRPYNHLEYNQSVHRRNGKTDGESLHQYYDAHPRFNWKRPAVDALLILIMALKKALY